MESADAPQTLHARAAAHFESHESWDRAIDHHLGARAWDDAIRLLLGLLKRDDGAIRILGLDPQREPMELRRRIGYLAEDQRMYGWMRVEEIVRFVAPFYPTWDHGLALKYLRDFELPFRTRVKHLSKGQNVRLGARQGSEPFMHEQQLHRCYDRFPHITRAR